MKWRPWSILIDTHDRRPDQRACRLRSLSAPATAPARLARLIAACGSRGMDDPKPGIKVVEAGIRCISDLLVK